MRLHSWLSSKCGVGGSRLHGHGVFAIDYIAKGELVALWGGVVYSAAEIEAIGVTFPHFLTHPYQISEGMFLGSTSLSAIDDAERFNHGCEPNVGVKGQIVVLARRAMLPGEELLFEYETTDIAPAPFDCHCGSEQCRGRIDGSAWRSDVFQKEHSEWLSWNVSQQIARL